MVRNIYILSISLILFMISIVGFLTCLHNLDNAYNFKGIYDQDCYSETGCKDLDIIHMNSTDFCIIWFLIALFTFPVLYNGLFTRE